jgi:glycosyltransferase involved in cell wall biosynthesis
VKLFQIHSSSLAENNGSNVHALELFQNITDLGIDVTIFSRKSKKNKCNNTKMIQVPFVDHKYLKEFSFQLMLFIYIINYSITQKPDIMYSRQSNNSFAPAIASYITKIPYVVEINGFIIDEMRMNRQSSLEIKFAQICESLNYYLCKKIIAVTNGIKISLQDMYSVPEEKIIVINNGANTDLFKPMNKTEAKNLLSLSLSDTHICFVGNLAPWQGVEYLIEASPIILKKYPRIKFLIVGNGPIKETLIQLAKEKSVLDYFLFVGSVPYEKVSLYINSSAICVAPFVNNRNEKIGLSALKMYEYLACNKPIVASDISGVGDLLDKSGGGIKVPPEDTNELASAIIKLIDNNDLRCKMGYNGRNYVVFNHSWKLVAKKVIDVCENTLKEA